MSITPHDVNALTDQSPGDPQVRPQDISRIVQVLNAHRHPTTTTANGGEMEVLGQPADGVHHAAHVPEREVAVGEERGDDAP